MFSFANSHEWNIHICIIVYFSSAILIMRIIINNKLNFIWNEIFLLDEINAMLHQRCRIYSRARTPFEKIFRVWESFCTPNRAIIFFFSFFQWGKFFEQFLAFEEIFHFWGRSCTSVLRIDNVRTIETGFKPCSQHGLNFFH
jgi:hypothetical protein